MGGAMGPGMMGGMMAPSDPKTQARMLRFRADMMKAMSDVMLKHAAELDLLRVVARRSGAVLDEKVNCTRDGCRIAVGIFEEPGINRIHHRHGAIV